MITPSKREEKGVNTMERKPIKVTLGFELDSNFNVQMFTKSQAVKRAKERLRRFKSHGCKQSSVIDCGEYWAISCF